MNFYAMSFDDIKRYYYDNGISHDAIGRLIELYDDLQHDNVELESDIETLKDTLSDIQTTIKGVL